MSDRLIAYLVDFTLLSAVTFALWLVSVVLGTALAIGVSAGTAAGPGSDPSGAGFLAQSLAGFVIGIGLWAVIGAVVFGYFTYLDGATKGTLGKRLMDVVVAREDGSQVTTSETAKRTAVLMAPFPVMVFLAVIVPLGFLIAVMLMVGWLVVEAALIATDDDKQRLGDRFAGTVVVERAPAGQAASEDSARTATAD